MVKWQLVTRWQTPAGDYVTLSPDLTLPDALAEAHRLARAVGVPAAGRVLTGVEVIGDTAELLAAPGRREG
jgi:hypothetical protein